MFMRQGSCSFYLIKVGLMFLWFKSLSLDHWRKHGLLFLDNYINRFQSLSLIRFYHISITGPFITLLNDITEHWRLFHVVKFIFHGFSVIEELLWNIHCQIHSFRTCYSNLRLSYFFWLLLFLVFYLNYFIDALSFVLLWISWLCMRVRVFLFVFIERNLWWGFKHTVFALSGCSADNWCFLLVFSPLLLFLPPLIHEIIFTVYFHLEYKFNTEFWEESCYLKLAFDIVPEVFPDFLDIIFLFLFMKYAEKICLYFVKILDVLIELTLDIEGDAFDVLFLILGG